MTKRRLFCSKPFTWFEVTGFNRTGEVYLCCPSWLETPVGTLEHQSVQEVWNGPTAQAIRASILDGSYKYCNVERCPFLNDLSGPVQYEDEVTDPELREVIEKQLTVMPYGPKDINCSYDRSCNLSCPSCRTELIVEMKNQKAILAVQQKINDEALSDARMLYITGSGDPFGSPFFRKWLQSMDATAMANLERIHLHSNGQLWTPMMWESIPADVRALIHTAEISIDAAAPETYAQNRRGGRFEKLLKNLEFISSLRRNGPLTWLGISMVVQANNFREMADFIRMGQHFGVDTVYFSQIVNWGTFSDQEFNERAVHFPTHPLHNEFKRVLQDPIFNLPFVYTGNLTGIKELSRAEIALLEQ